MDPRALQKPADAGYASHPDNLERHANVNQKEWLSESARIINKFAKNITQLDNFTSAYQLLAEERHYVAAKLQQGAKGKRTDDYGTPRAEYAGAHEVIHSQDIPQVWSGMRLKLYDLFDILVSKKAPIEQYDPATETMILSSVLGGKNYTYKEEEMLDNRGKQYVLRKIEVNNSHYQKGIQNISYSFATIYTYKYVNPVDAKQELSVMPKDVEFASAKSKVNIQDEIMIIEYAEINKYNQKGDFAIADTYYKAILAIPDGKEKINSFLEQASNLMHLIAHLLPVKLGNAGIMEWMIRGLAFKKGINLGPFNRDEGISWDFKALLTPDKNDYKKWFCEKAFVNVKLLTTEQITKEFSFQENTLLEKTEPALSKSGLSVFTQPVPQSDALVLSEGNGFFCLKKFSAVKVVDTPSATPKK